MNDGIQTLKSFLLDPERADANKRLMDKSYWGDSGEWVLEAIGIIERTINEFPIDDNSRFEPWLNELIAVIEAKYMYFRDHARDPDGYGCGTFRQVLNRLYGLRDSIEPPAPDEIVPPPKTDRALLIKIALFLLGLLIFFLLNLHSAFADEHPQISIELYVPQEVKYDQVCTLNNLKGETPQKILSPHDFATPRPIDGHWQLSSEWTRDRAVHEIQEHCFILKSKGKNDVAGVVLSIYTERMSHIPVIFISGKMQKEQELVSDLFNDLR